MAFVVNFKASAAISAGPWEIEIGPNKQNDVILIFVQDRDSGSTLAISGYTALDSARSGYSYQSRWFAKVVGATPETNPSLTTGGRPSAHKGAIAYVIRGADISGTVAQIFPQINYVYAGAAARTVSSPAITTTSANNLLIHCAFFDAACVMPDFTAVNATVMTKSSNSKACSAVGFQAAAGAIPTFNWTAARADIQGSSWVLAVKNAAGGDAPLRMVEGRAMLAMLSGFSTLTTSVPNSVSSTINSIDCTSAASTFPALSQPPTWQWAVDAISITGTENFATPASKWCGAYIAITATNIVGKIVVVPWSTMSANDSARVGPAGAIVVFADASNNYVAYQLKKQTELLTYMYDQLVIKPGTTTPYAGSTAGLGDIVKIGFLYQRMASQTASVGFYYQLPVIENSPCKMIGGGPNNPITVAAETDFIYGGGYFHGECSFQGSGQLVNRMGLQIGDGATATYLKHRAQSYDVPSPLELPWNVGAGAVPFIIKTSANDVIDLSSAVITSSTLQPFTVDASSSLSASLLTVGLSVIGRTFSDLAGFDWVSASWVECDTVAFKNGDVTNCSISKTVSTGAACSFSASGASVSGTTIDVDGTSAAYHLELGTAVTAITLADVTFTGTPGTDKVHVLKTSGTVTITISGTTSLVAGDVTSAGATVVIAAPSPTLDATVLSGSRVVLYNDTTAAELDNTAPAGTSWSKVITSGASSGDTLTLHVFKEGYEEFSTSFIYAGIDNTLLVSQSVHAAISSLRTELGITDYTTITEFALDITGTVEIDADDADGSTTKARLAIWYNGVLTTENGARYLRGAISVLSTAAIRINTSVLDLKIENISVTYGLNFTDTERRLYRDDGAAIYAAASAAGSIQNDYSGVPDTVTTSDQSLNLATAEQAIDNKLSSISSGVWAYVVTGSTTAVQMMRGFAAMLLGKVSGAGTGAETFRDIADTKDVATFTVDSSGNRTAVTRDLT